MMMAMAALSRIQARLKDRRGQNTVEYLLMLTVVVGVVLVAGMALKKFMPSLFAQIQNMISGAAGSLGSNSGN
jgi:Flp pilus assembly pilin Flp